jgi:tetratricopeptide (TPR) repeat protein
MSEIHREIDRLFAAQEYRQTLALVEYALVYNPFDVKLYRAKAKTYQALRDFKNAERWYTALITHNAPMFDDYYSRATIRNEMSDYPGTIRDLDVAELISKDSVDVYLKRGGAYWEMRDWDKAKVDFERALKMSPNHPDAIWINGLLDLQLGRFDTGWSRYEARWKSARFKSNRLVTSKPQWSPGSGLKRVLVWGEQGIGDQIFYASMLNRLRYEVDKVTMLIDPRLIPLFQRSLPTIDFLPNTSEVPVDEHDSHLPIASIGAQFVHSIDDIEQAASRRYLKADPARVAHVRERIPKDKPLIGISWTSAAVKIGPHKSISMEALKPLIDLTQYQFVNLQYTQGVTESADPRILRTSINCRDDFESLAALLEVCDAVVSVSSSTVHLAGALGRPVYLMDANKLWYWGNKDGDRSLWYPSVRVFPRDHVLAPWTNVVEKIYTELLNDQTQP